MYTQKCKNASIQMNEMITVYRGCLGGKDLDMYQVSVRNSSWTWYTHTVHL